MAFAEGVNGITIHYTIHQPDRKHDAHQTIVLVNGLADDQTTWTPQVPAFTRAGYTVLCFDNRGVGQSSRPEGPYTADMLAGDLHALLLRLNINQFHLLGISMGGMILQSYALAYPNGSMEAQGLTMLSLSLCCTYAEPTRFCSRMFDLWSEMAARMSVQDVMRDVLLWCFSVSFFREREKDLLEVEDAMKNLDIKLPEYLAQLNVIQAFDTTSQLQHLRNQQQTLGRLQKGQIMVLAGEQDILIPTQLSKELHARLMVAEWRTTPGGHGCALEYPEEFNETVLTFLKSVTAAS